MRTSFAAALAVLLAPSVTAADSGFMTRGLAGKKGDPKGSPKGTKAPKEPKGTKSPKTGKTGKDGKNGKKDRSRVFISVLNAAQEVDPDPVVTSEALGNAYVTLEDHTMCIMMAYQGLSAPELFSHIHQAPLGVNGPVVFNLTETPVKTDCFDLDRDQKDALQDGEFYFNVHTPNFPMGEIRGQIL